MLNVLLVDDSLVIRKMLRRTLNDANLGITEIFEAADGGLALNLLATTQIHLILCDVNMPVMGGLEFLENLCDRVELSTIPVLMVTTEGGQESVMKAVKLGAKGYIRKPFTPDEIKQKLTECLKAAAA
jgi:two-component system, chemotaxis family, chemotaxis protein CheY